MVAFPVVDSHIHLIDPSRLAYRWLQNNSVLRRRHALLEYGQAQAGRAVAAIVAVEADADDADKEILYLLEQAENDSRIGAIVAHLPLEQGERLEETMASRATTGRVKGLRRLLQDEPAPGFCLQPGFIEGVRLAGRFDLTVDLCIRQHQLQDLIKLVDACPKTRFVLDHIAKPAIRDGALEPWRREFRDLAARPNIVCKLSGVATEADPIHWTPEQLRPYIDHAWESFGASRLLFGSDWPVCLMAVDWIAWVEILEAALAAFSDNEKRAFWGRNAIAAYKMDATLLETDEGDSLKTTMPG
ncbi:L-fuconolactonase [Arboricoccus pini]|uniref:L-fuconolactonase n=1 Tax=Arboricoccus pini TaxID=1963835 RepID=A0A212RCX8_9PROT|nr:amidohydrolase family protein [Arboricoccus pini]SNB70098.1 L-fuconolactonase [Arboricoccus pini]